MNRFLLTATLMVTILALTATVDAAGPHSGSPGKPTAQHGGSSNNGRTTGNRGHDARNFSRGHYYYGRNHSHWTYRYHLSQYGCDCYWCPDTSSWYYWCEPRYSYLPVSCIEFATPTRTVAAAAASSSSSAVGPTVVAPIIITGSSVPSSGPAPSPPILPRAAAAASSATGVGPTVVAPVVGGGSVPTDLPPLVSPGGPGAPR